MSDYQSWKAQESVGILWTGDSDSVGGGFPRDTSGAGLGAHMGRPGADSGISLFTGDESRFRSQTNQVPALLLFNMSALVSCLQGWDKSMQMLHTLVTIQ